MGGVQVAPNHLPFLVGGFIFMVLLFLGMVRVLNRYAR